MFVIKLWLEWRQKKRQKRHTQKTQVSIKLMASLAPARAEVEAGAVAKADQNILCADMRNVFFPFQ